MKTFQLARCNLAERHSRNDQTNWFSRQRQYEIRWFLALVGFLMLISSRSFGVLSPCDECDPLSCNTGSVDNPGTLSKTNATVCIGGSVSTPSISGTTFKDGWSTLTCRDKHCNSTTSTNVVRYFATNWFEPEIPSVFLSPGTFSFAAKVKGIAGGRDCPDDTATKDVGTYTVTVLDYSCKNPHAFQDTFYECVHYNDDTNGTPCLTDQVIMDVIDTSTCDMDTNNPCHGNCNLTDGTADGIDQSVYAADCPGGNVNWHDRETLYSGCSDCDNAAVIRDSCLTGAPPSGSVRLDGPHARAKKKVPCQ